MSFSDLWLEGINIYQLNDRCQITNLKIYIYTSINLFFLIDSLCESKILPYVYSLSDCS